MKKSFWMAAVGTMAVTLMMSPARAGLVDINFSASGSASGGGDFIVDSSLLAPNSVTLSTLAGASSLNLSLDFGGGPTVFGLGDLNSFDFRLATDGSGSITDLNFWGDNGVATITGVTFFTGNGPSGQFLYTVNAVSDVPEPASLALLGFGIAGLSSIRRKRG